MAENFWETWEPDQYQEHVKKLKAQRAYKDGRSEHEHNEQVELFRWASSPEALRRWGELHFLFAIPNGGFRHVSVAKYMKAEGLKAGVPDIFLPAPMGGYHGLWIEMKHGKNKPTERQKTWLAYLKKCGYCTAVCYGAKEAKEAIKAYLSQSIG